MTLVPARIGTTRKHAFLDIDAHGVYAYSDGPSTYLPELPYRLLQSLTLQEYDSVIPYERIVAYMWRAGVPAPYDGSYDTTVRSHLSGIRAVMARDGHWPQSPFEVKASVGIRVISALLPSDWR